jgi:two-component system cell cycle sensor histidine kinase/response regulator CckA
MRSLDHWRDHGRAPFVEGTTVLVVDDEPLMRTVMKRVLIDEGYVVLTAASAREALALASSGGRADLVLTDLLMPGMDGVELARRLAELWPETPVVFMSGEQQEPARRAGLGGDVLEKPFAIESLLRTIRDALARDAD